ncbi:MAG: DUF374 domain-containing protein [Acidobacteriia bacterium]|nr:DUF374 domain-containing protein [Terriglobia bacterium]
MSERSWYLTGRAAALMLRLWRCAVRVEVRNKGILKPPYVLALWHGRVIGSMMDNFDCRCVTMASRSNDGALAAGIVEGLGLKATRGSGSRGGREALDEMEDMVRAGCPFAALTVDGPRGPWRRVKTGAVVLARRLGVPIYAVTFSATRPRVLRSWDHMVLPSPFSKVVVAYAGPWSSDVPADGISATAERVGQEIDSLTAALDREVAGEELWPST